jgi:phosphotriesterase-related protein
MFDAGYGTSLLIGNDLGRPSYWRAYGGGPGLDYVLTTFVPRLALEGFSQDEIDTLLIHNPRRFLAHEPRPTAG